MCLILLRQLKIILHKIIDALRAQNTFQIIKIQFDCPNPNIPGIILCFVTFLFCKFPEPFLTFSKIDLGLVF